MQANQMKTENYRINCNRLGIWKIKKNLEIFRSLKFKTIWNKEIRFINYFRFWYIQGVQLVVIIMHISVALKTTLGITSMITQSQKFKIIKLNMKYRKCSEVTVVSQVPQLICFNIVATTKIWCNKIYLMI